MLTKKVLVSVFFGILVLLPMATFLLPKESFSELENRSLAKPPELSWSSVMDKSYMKDAEDFMADHIVFRNQFAKAKTDCELLTGKQEIGGVFIGSGMLMEDVAEPNARITRNNADAINAFAKNHAGRIETTLMLVPTASEIYPSRVPAFAQPIDQTKYIQDFYASLHQVNTVDVYTSLAAAESEYIYYRTDHHWTSYGAYIGYTALAKNLGYKAATADTFNVEHASHTFLGTLYSKALTGEEWQDIVDLYTYAAGDAVEDVVKYSARNTVTYSSIFFRENLEKKDKYTVFLGGNDPIVKIRTRVGNGKRIIVFKDSFANSLMQFLPYHYEEILLVDLRYFNGNLSDYVNLADYQQALFLYNVGNFTDDNSISKVSRY